MKKAEHLLFLQMLSFVVLILRVCYFSATLLFFPGQAQGLNCSSSIYGALSEGAPSYLLPAF